jgi:ribosome biogenesis protein SSF1/2
MFPTINVKTVKLGDCRRVVLFHYHKESDTVEVRHYAIRANPVGISRTVKRVVQASIPNLGNLEDISDFIDGSGFSGSVSDSEAEDESSRASIFISVVCKVSYMFCR